MMPDPNPYDSSSEDHPLNSRRRFVFFRYPNKEILYFCLNCIAFKLDFILMPSRNGLSSGYFHATGERKQSLISLPILVVCACTSFDCKLVTLVYQLMHDHTCEPCEDPVKGNPAISGTVFFFQINLMENTD